MKKALNIVLSMLALFAVAVPMTGNAQVVTTVSSSAPTSFFANSTASTGGLQWRDDTTNGLRNVGQTFLAGSDLNLDSITFEIATNAAAGAGALGASFTLAVYQVSSASAFPTGTALSTQTGTLSGLTGTSSDFSKYVTFDLADVSLTNGNYYAVLLSFNTQAANENVTWQVSTTPASYANGQAIVTTNGTTFSANNDLVFYATATAVAVPEPGTAALLGLGMALVFLTLRYRASLC